jgi:hypothetical protein
VIRFSVVGNVLKTHYKEKVVAFMPDEEMRRDA